MRINFTNKYFFHLKFKYIKNHLINKYKKVVAPQIQFFLCFHLAGVPAGWVQRDGLMTISTEEGAVQPVSDCCSYGVQICLELIIHLKGENYI